MVPHIARPAAESTRSLVPWRWLLPAALLTVAVAVLWRLFRRRPLMQGLVIGGLFVAVVWLIYPTPLLPPLAEPAVTTTAEVRGVRTVTRALISGRSIGRREAPQPYDVVELHFVPQGRDQAVVAVDSVDAGSVLGLAVGARVAVNYSDSDPRGARQPGARTYRWREWAALATNVLRVIGLLVGLVLLRKLAGFWWRKLTRPE